MRWSPASGWIAVCSRNGQVAMFPPGPLTEPRITPASTVQLRCVEFPPDGLSLSLPWCFVVGTGGCLTDSSARCLLSRCSPDGVVPLTSPSPYCHQCSPLPPPPKDGLGCCPKPYSDLRWSE
jgi:hypothetical protein